MIDVFISTGLKPGDGFARFIPLTVLTVSIFLATLTPD
jgi:hypothetical protein